MGYIPQQALIISLKTKDPKLYTFLQNVDNYLSNDTTNPPIGLDTYLDQGTILHKLVTKFQSVVSFLAGLVVSGISTFTGAATFNNNVILPNLTPSLPLKININGHIISATIVLSSTADISGILARANGGFGNAVITAYPGTCSGSFSGTIDTVHNTCAGTFTGTTSTSI